MAQLSRDTRAWGIRYIPPQVRNIPNRLDSGACSRLYDADNMENAMDSMGMGALARRAGVSIDTVRYYGKGGLLSPRAGLASDTVDTVICSCPDCVSFV